MFSGAYTPLRKTDQILFRRRAAKLYEVFDKLRTLGRPKVLSSAFLILAGLMKVALAFSAQSDIIIADRSYLNNNPF